MSNTTRRSVILGGAGLLLGGDALAGSRKRRRRQRARKSVPDHEAVLADLAARLWFGERDQGKTIGELEAMLARGENPEVLCGNHSLLAFHALQRAGVEARQVGSFRRPYLPGPDDGHVMVEVRVGKAWHCYDVMGNVQAVDEAGRGLSVVEWCAQSTHHWRRIATDPTWPQEENLAAIYNRVLGTPWIGLNDLPLEAVFSDPENAAAITAGYPWLRLIGRRKWKQLQA